jgi:nucleoside-diphosphate-sugar epimerase
MKAVVTGAAGFIGSHLCEQLLANGANVVGLDCFTDYYPRAFKDANLSAFGAHPRFTLVEARIQDADLPNLLDGATHVFHLAAQAGVRKSWGTDFRQYMEHNIEATQVLLEACTRMTLQRLVYASSSSVYGDEAPIPMREDQRVQPVSPYGVTKLAAEHLCHLYHLNYGVPAVSVRYFTVYGPRQRPDMGFHRFLKAALMSEPIHLYGDGTQTRDFTFVKDVVSASISAATRGTPGRVYNVGGGSRVSVNEVLALVTRLVGRPLDIRCEATQKGDMRDTYADTTLARRELAYVPSVALEEGLGAEFRWLSAILERS